MAQPVLTKAFLQPAKPEKWPSQCRPRLFYSQPRKLLRMCMAPRAETSPPPPIPLFFLAQNLSSKWIAPTDTRNMRPKLHDEYTRHKWLKG